MENSSLPPSNASLMKIPVSEDTPKPKSSNFQTQMAMGAKSIEKNRSSMLSQGEGVTGKIAAALYTSEGSFQNQHSLQMTGGLRKSNYKQQQSLQQQLSLQKATRNSESRVGHVKVMQNIMKQAKKQRKAQKKAKQLDKKQNTMLKRAHKVNASFTNKNSAVFEQTEENEDDNQDFESLEEQQRHQNKDKCILLPENPLKNIWDFFILFLILYESLVVPFTLCFQETDNKYIEVSDLVINIFFLIDIILTFNTGIYQRGLLVLIRKAIILSYLKGWFVIDLLSTIPYSFIFDQVVDSSDLQRSFAIRNAPLIFRLFRVMRFLRILKLMRVLKIQQFIIAFEEYIVSDEVLFFMNFGKPMVISFFLAHWIACFYWAVGVREMEEYEHTWIRNVNLQDEPTGKQYVTSLYWALQTMTSVGYGDTSPVTRNEQLYVMCAMIISSGMYAYTLNNIGKMVSRYNVLAAQYREKMMYVNQFMIHQNIPKPLRMRIRSYLEYIWEMKKTIKIEHDEVFDLLNDSLREKVTVSMNGMILQTISFFEEFDMEFVMELTFHSKNANFGMDDNIFLVRLQFSDDTLPQEGDEGDKIFYILQGRVAVLHRKTLTYLEDLIRDDYFGEIAFFTDKKRCATVKSRDFTEVFIIEQEQFLDLAVNFGTVIQKYNEMKDAILIDNNYQMIRLECFICKKIGHRALDCQYFGKVKGNLIQIYNKMSKKKTDSLSTSMVQMQVQVQGTNNTQIRNTPATRKAANGMQQDSLQSPDCINDMKEAQDQEQDFSVEQQDSEEEEEKVSGSPLASVAQTDRELISRRLGSDRKAEKLSANKSQTLASMPRVNENFTLDALHHIKRTLTKKDRRKSENSNTGGLKMGHTLKQDPNQPERRASATKLPYDQSSDNSVVINSDGYQSLEENMKESKKKNSIQSKLQQRLREEMPGSVIIEESNSNYLGSEFSLEDDIVQSNQQPKRQAAAQSQKQKSQSAISFSSANELSPISGSPSPQRLQAFLQTNLDIVPEEDEMANSAKASHKHQINTNKLQQ